MTNPTEKIKEMDKEIKTPYDNGCGEEINLIKEIEGIRIIYYRCGENPHPKFRYCKSCKGKQEAYKQGLSDGKEEVLGREKSMKCLKCGISLHREILDKTIHLHLCEKCRIEELKQQLGGKE